MANIELTKAQALELYDGNAARMARALGITRSAVYQWADGPIGAVHALRIRYVLKPEAFEQNKEAAA